MIRCLCIGNDGKFGTPSRMVPTATQRDRLRQIYFFGTTEYGVQHHWLAGYCTDLMVRKKLFTNHEDKGVE